MNYNVGPVRVWPYHCILRYSLCMTVSLHTKVLTVYGRITAY
jgi:hypothetical protein